MLHHILLHLAFGDPGLYYGSCRADWHGSLDAWRDICLGWAGAGGLQLLPIYDAGDKGGGRKGLLPLHKHSEL